MIKKLKTYFSIFFLGRFFLFFPSWLSILFIFDPKFGFLMPNSIYGLVDMSKIRKPDRKIVYNACLNAFKRFCGVLRIFCVVLCTRGALGLLWAALGALLGALGAFLGTLGTLLEAIGALLGRS